MAVQNFCRNEEIEAKPVPYGSSQLCTDSGCELIVGWFLVEYNLIMGREQQKT
jgi:hypothetical protein